MDSKLWYGFKFFRSTLKEGDKKNYDLLYKGIMNGKEEIPLLGVSLEKGKRIVDAVLADNPMFFNVENFKFLVTFSSLIVKPIYRMTDLQLSTYATQLEATVSDLAFQSRNHARSTQEIIRILHDKISFKIQYCDIGVVAHTVIGPLLVGQGVCEGIAKSVKLICDRLGVPSAVILGRALSQSLGKWENHAWNMIKIDGCWSFFDFTYDITLNIGNPCPGLVRYDYFGLSFDEISVDHKCNLAGIPLEHRSNSYFGLHNLIVGNHQELSRLIARVINRKNKDVAFKVLIAWHDFSPENDLPKALSLRSIIAGGIGATFTYSYNAMQRVCYVHFS